MKIRINYDFYAPASECWTAIDDDTYDGVPYEHEDGRVTRSPMGCGPSAMIAIFELLDEIKDRAEAELQAKIADDEARDKEDADIDQHAFNRAHAWGRS